MPGALAEARPAERRQVAPQPTGRGLAATAGSQLITDSELLGAKIAHYPSTAVCLPTWPTRTGQLASEAGTANEAD